ncbi:MAG: 30S ribosomal protein S15 [Nanoarchaeota archaeon]|nr:MAG: 30S ribosomal protein S15 [Nanoarchaeota archaeon]
MAKMHSRARGRAGSKKPVHPNVSWVSYKPKEVELIIGKLSKEGNSPSKIGMVMRDTYGVPDVELIVGKKITEILVDKKIAPVIPEDLMSLIKKNILIKKHLEKNKKDMPAKRGLHLTESKIRRLVKYYKRSERLAKDWTYDPDKIRLLLE